jgi:CelD/BcsL family acetyltransferase involved in cellulose biosynthesis
MSSGHSISQINLRRAFRNFPMSDGIAKRFQIVGRMRAGLRALLPAGLKIADEHGGDFDPLESHGLVAKCYRDWPDCESFIPRWNALLARNPKATVFRSPEWQAAVVNQFVPAGQFRLLTVERGSELLAVLPLGLNTASLLETPGRWACDYLDPLVDESCELECWELMLRLLVKLWDWSVTGVRFHNIRATSSLRDILPKIAASSGFKYGEKQIEMAPYISLPDSWDAYLATIDGHERKEIKRKLRNAETKGEAKWLTWSKPEELEEPLDRALRALRQSADMKADFADEVLCEFLRNLAPQVARIGAFSIQELWIQNKPSAWMLTLKSDRGPMIFNTCYDFAQRNWSPGIVAFAMAIREAIAQKHPVFNLLRGAEEYKKRIGAVDMELFQVNLQPV